MRLQKTYPGWTRGGGEGPGNEATEDIPRLDTRGEGGAWE